METDYYKVKDLAREITRGLTFQDREQLYFTLAREMRHIIEKEDENWCWTGKRKEREDD